MQANHAVRGQVYGLLSKLTLANQKGIIMKWTTLTFKELAAQRTLRLDAKYWIKKKKRQATSSKRQAASLTDPAIQDKIGPEQKGKLWK